MLTSGAYYVAVAADKIYVNPNTLTGSVGVVMKGFGFVDFMKKIGVERRVYIAGNAKDRLRSFLPQTPEDLKKITQVMSEVHDKFCTSSHCKAAKVNCKVIQPHLFNGDFWSGQTALKLGLVDGLGNLMDVAEKEFNTTSSKNIAGLRIFSKCSVGNWEVRWIQLRFPDNQFYVWWISADVRVIHQTIKHFLVWRLRLSSRPVHILHQLPVLPFITRVLILILIQHLLPDRRIILPDWNDRAIAADKLRK